MNRRLLPNEKLRVPLLLLAACLRQPADARNSEAGVGPPLEAGSELEELRALEGKVKAVIQATRQAFVFIEGGSGFLIKVDGAGEADEFVLTNEHVVEGKGRILVQLIGGKSLRANVLGHDPEGDVALLKLEGTSGVRPLDWGDSQKLVVGEPVIALGDPFLIASRNLFLEGAPPDFEPSASLGVVSALHRYSDSYTDAIQVDVAVNRGNSGGPLLDLDGKVLGINGKIETRFDNIGINTGVGYAVPAHQIKRFLEPLRNAGGGLVRHGSILGLEVAERPDSDGGLLVEGVKPGSHASSAGFKAGDKLLCIDDQLLFTRTRLLGILGTYPAGQVVKVKAARPHTSGAQEKPTLENLELAVPLLEAGSTPFLGMKTELAPGPEGGVTVVEVVAGSPADRAGIKVNDRILSFQGKKVDSTADLKVFILERRAGDEVEIRLLREGKPMEFKVRLGGKTSFRFG